MESKKPKVVIIGAGMAGLTAANKLYTVAGSKQLLDLCVVEGGDRIGGRINTSEFGGDRIEMGATWIHGIGGSPLYKIAQEVGLLDSNQAWECMDGFLDDSAVTIAEGGYELNPSLVDPISDLFNKLMDFAQGKLVTEDAAKLSCNGKGVGVFLRKGLDAYWDSVKGDNEVVDKWSRRSLEEGVFAMLENTQRTYTSAGDLQMLDFNAEKEYRAFPGEELTIAKGYSSVIQHLASVLPPGLIQLGRKVTNIEWRIENGASNSNKPVKLHFEDGSIMCADHVIVTVSLGVLKQGIQENSGLFNPPLPSFKAQAITRLGFGVVNKLFLKLDQEYSMSFPFLQMVYHKSDSKLKHPKIPWWMRRTAYLSPIYKRSSVLLSWFAGKEALELESLDDEEILGGVSETISSFLLNSKHLCNGHGNSSFKVEKVLKSQWGTDPLFLGSYSYVAVGSSGDDLDAMAEPLPKRSSIITNGCVNSNGNCSSTSPAALQVLFAGEATHRTHYSTTHGAYFSGLREANRLLQHYHCIIN